MKESNERKEKEREGGNVREREELTERKLRERK